MRRLRHLLISLLLLGFCGAALGAPFTYNPPGKLKSGSGTGQTKSTVQVSGMRFPIEKAPAYLNSQVWGHGGSQGPGGGQCDAPNFSYPWWDNYCETRTWSMPLCPAGKGHQGQDIRASSCAKNTHWVVATEAGTITSIGSYSVYHKGNSGVTHRYLHMEPSSLQVKVGSTVAKGQKIGRVSNAFGGTPTTIHLHYDMKKYVSGYGSVYVSPYMSLVKSYEALVGASAPTLPAISISSKTSAKDTRPEGKSKGIGDVYEGDTFTVDIFVKNAATGAKTQDHVQVGYWFQSPYITPTGYTIYTDWPAKDGKTWKVNDANSEPKNPSHTSPPASGKMNIYVLSPGETKRIKFTVKAAKYSIGATDHPDGRAWVWHVGNYYGEQTGWSDKVETNKAGKVLQTYVQHDVYGKTHWQWNGTEPELEGWSKKKAIPVLKVNESVHAMAISQGGSDPSVLSPTLAVDAAKYKGVKMRVRHHEGAKTGQIFFTTKADATWNEAKSAKFVAKGDGAFHDVTVGFATNKAWKGTITRLRLDPTSTSTKWYDLDWLKFVADGGVTSGDADGDGHLVGADCDDTNAKIHPGASEICNGKDDDCDGKTDEGLKLGTSCKVGVGACKKTGVLACKSGKVACSATAGAPVAEVCNGKDDDCDGKSDEDWGLGEPCERADGACVTKGLTICTPDGAATVCDAPTPEKAPETCNGQDDDCDGEVDEGLGVGAPCVSGLGICEAKGAIVCTATFGTACSAAAFEPGAELCDGLDNDCDGAVDDGWDIGAPCDAVILGCPVEGALACAADGAGVTCHGEAPSAPCGGVDPDAGSWGEDAGSPGQDAGSWSEDGGSWGEDTGSSPNDAGATGEDAGADSGSWGGLPGTDTAGAPGGLDAGDWDEGGAGPGGLGAPPPLATAPAGGPSADGCNASGRGASGLLPLVLLAGLAALRRRRAASA